MPQMTPQERVEKLAEYFTGPCVALHSMGLSSSDRFTRLAADKYYEARGAVNVDGYMGKDEAIIQIARALGVNMEQGEGK